MPESRRTEWAEMWLGMGRKLALLLPFMANPMSEQGQGLIPEAGWTVTVTVTGGLEQHSRINSGSASSPTALSLPGRGIPVKRPWWEPTSPAAAWEW